MRRTLKQERLQSLARSGEASGSGSYSDNSYAGVEARQSREQVLRAVDALPEREAKIIRHHYLQQIPFDDIAGSLGLTKGRVSQLHRRALQCRLRMLQDGGGCQLSA